MKKVTSLLLLAGVAAFGLVGCGDDVTGPGSITGVTVSPESITIEVGETQTLSASVEGSGDTGVTWSSSQPSIASVDSDGNVTGVAEGNTTVTATSTADPNQSASAQVRVTPVGGDRPTISILGIECDDSIADCSEPDNIEGDLDVTVNVDEGGADIASVQLLLNGEVVREQTFSTAIAGLSQQTQGTSNITFELDTDGAGECTMGEVLTPNIENGLKELQARLILEEGDDETATWDDSLNFDNENRIEVVHIEGTGATAVGGGAVNNSTAPEGQRFWGQNFAPDAENPILTFAACPVVFEGDITVGEIRLSGATSSTADDKDFDVDLGAGHGAQLVDDEAPFQYPADAAVNDSVEDTNGGHTIGDDVDVFTDEGEDVTGSFTIVSLDDFWLDFTGPMDDPTDGEAIPAIAIDGMAIMAEHYTDEASFTLPDGTVLSEDGPPVGDYQVTGINDGGVGFDPSGVLADVFHDTVADITMATPIAEDLDGLNDAEKEGCVVPGDGFCLEEQGDPDETPVATTDPDAYIAQVPELMDILGNTEVTIGNTDNDFSGLVSSPEHGIDRTEPAGEQLTGFEDGAILASDTLLFQALDPVLNNENGDDPGSGVDDSGCGVVCTSIHAFLASNDSILDVDDDGTPAMDEATADYRIDMVNLNDDGTIEYTVLAAIPDLGVKVPNADTLTWTFTLDSEAPNVTVNEVEDADTNADAIEYTVTGNLTEPNLDTTSGLSVIGIFFPDGTRDGTATGACDSGPMTTGDDVALTEGSGPDMVADQSRDIDATGGFNEVFTIQGPDNAERVAESGAERVYCFRVDASDLAVDVNGDPAPNRTFTFIRAIVNWQPMSP